MLQILECISNTSIVYNAVSPNKNIKYAKIPPMKYNLLISLLFFIATTLMAVHEVEHITHDHASCEICILVNNFVSPDLSLSISKVEILHFGAILCYITKPYYHQQSSTYEPRAPPSIS
ncbi:MAG: hypothetical protein RBR59_00005 [Sulfurimonadaceae bacterium]|jgi:hypothetical protein|nr:hypothetical protein [Sulfurimonadaceae bacterium]